MHLSSTLNLVLQVFQMLTEFIILRQIINPVNIVAGLSHQGHLFKNLLVFTS